MLFFSELSCPGRVWKEFGTKNFLSSSRPISFWLEIMPERGFFCFFYFFFQFFSEFSCPGRVWTEFGTKIFFFSFSAYLIPFSRKIMPERGFSIFWTFFLFFSEFSCLGRVWTKFGTKFFFSFSAYLNPFWLKIIPERGSLIFFAIFLGIFLPESIVSGIQD